MRVSWIEASPGNPRHEALWDFMRKSVRSYIDGRAELHFEHLPFVTGGIRSSPGRLVNDVAVLATAARLESESDLLILGCWGAPTVQVRDLLSIPVASVAEAAARFTAMLCSRAVVVTVAPPLVPIFAQDLRALGSSGPGSGFHAERPVRSYLPESTHDEVMAAIDDPGPLIERFNAAARLAVEDGADAIVVGCAYLASIFSAHGYRAVGGYPEIPIIDVNRLAVEQAFLLDRIARGAGQGGARSVPAREPLLAALARISE